MNCPHCLGDEIRDLRKRVAELESQQWMNERIGPGLTRRRSAPMYQPNFLRPVEDVFCVTGKMRAAP